MLPVRRKLWLTELESYVVFAPPQDAVAYNLDQMLQQVKEMNKRSPDNLWPRVNGGTIDRTSHNGGVFGEDMITEGAKIDAIIPSYKTDDRRPFARVNVPMLFEPQLSCFDDSWEIGSAMPTTRRCCR